MTNKKYMSAFLEKYRSVRDEQNSILSIGLDPVAEELQKLGYTFDLSDYDAVAENYLQFLLYIVESTKGLASAYKPNTQFVRPLNIKQMRILTDKIHSVGSVAILDHKLSDIGKTNKEGIHWIKEQGFDAFTYSPWPGNLSEATNQSHEMGLGIIVLDLMSNPEAEIFMKRKMRTDGLKLDNLRLSYNELELLGYEIVALKVNEAGADGVVVGATGHVTPEDIRQIRKLIGSYNLIFSPGVGTQGGDEKKIIENGGEDVMINVGSDIIFKKNPNTIATIYNDRFNQIRKPLK